ncbi:tetratricopeptide repeat protein [Flavobacterium sp.]
MKQLLIYFILLTSFASTAQKKEKDLMLSQGNEAFAEKKYADAEADFRISHSKFPKKATASYNLGNAIYRQKQVAEAKYQFAKAIKIATSKSEKHQAFHNLGNCLMTEKEYEGAVEAYKNALRNNPNDEETRYNFALAKKQLENNPPKSEDDKNKNKDKNKDKKEDKKDQDKKDDKDKKDKDKDKKDQKKEGDKDKDQQDKNNDKNGQPKPQPDGISKERIQNMLDAVNNEEKKIQDKVNQQKVRVNPNKPEKDW